MMNIPIAAPTKELSSLLLYKIRRREIVRVTQPKQGNASDLSSRDQKAQNGLTFILFYTIMIDKPLLRCYGQLKEDLDMQIIEMGRPLTENELLGVKRADKYLNGWGDFAMIGENVFLSLDNADVAKDPQGACQEAREQMKSILNRHPDFSTMIMKDNHMLILMEFAGAFGREALSKEECKDSKTRLAHSLALRNELLAACEKGEILALVDIA